MSHSIEEFKTEFIKYIEKKYHKKWLIAVEKKRVFSLVLATALAYLEPIPAVGRRMAKSWFTSFGLDSGRHLLIPANLKDLLSLYAANILYLWYILALGHYVTCRRSVEPWNQLGYILKLN